MTNSVVVFTVLVLAALATAQAQHGGSGYGQQPQKGYKEEQHPYKFEYVVDDQHYGPQFRQSESSDGNEVKGSYTVQLPDGRTQTVEYRADHYSGFNADVKYEGKAQYPETYGPAFTVKPNGGGYKKPVAPPSYGPPPKQY